MPYSFLIPGVYGGLQVPLDDPTSTQLHANKHGIIQSGVAVLVLDAYSTQRFYPVVRGSL